MLPPHVYNAVAPPQAQTVGQTVRTAAADGHDEGAKLNHRRSDAPHALQYRAPLRVDEATVI
jgi:hypothetical protein